ncbi:galactarate/glucarate/glycerate transporter GudP [Paraburkholderia tropica]|uniref:MFS transporter n=1 Tax=Paraburkholderia tropica TaxID=92647 RepID=UPI001CB15FA8|nr:MFS transporter [Paraburkholderia tropica]CAG9193064.1 galactarate/glucarate/glycerate transporter GudP [Paraburkholderia tropica]
MQRDSIACIAREASRSKVRYVVLAMIFMITALNYGDRATLSITASAMKGELGLNAVQMGYLFSAFSWAYTLSQLPSGWLLDRFGARRVYGGSILLWSCFTLLQGVASLELATASILVVLFALRFFMGIAEAPAFPANAKIVSTWFPATERGMASAVFNSAQYFSAVVFTPLMAWITHTFGWQYVYVTMGVLGVTMAFVWMRAMKEPHDHPHVNQAELDYIGQSATAERREEAVDALMRLGGWACARQLLSNRMLLGIYLGQFSISVLTYFFLTWFPVYLVQARGMTIMQAGVTASLPAICGFLGGLLGGAFSDALARRGYSLSAARKLPIVLGMLLSLSIVGCNYVKADGLVIVLMSMAFFGKGFGALGWAVLADASPKAVVGLCGSIFNLFGNLAGIVTPIVIGYLIAGSGSFNGALLFVGANALLAIFSYLVIVGKIERVKLVQ